MFDDVISTGLQAVLAEVFESVDKNQLNVSLVGDIFKESHLELTDLRLKKTLLKDMNLPVEVKEGLVGKLVIQGLSGEWQLQAAARSGGLLRVIRSDAHTHGMWHSKRHSSRTADAAVDIQIPTFHTHDPILTSKTRRCPAVRPEPDLSQLYPRCVNFYFIFAESTPTDQQRVRE